MKTLFAASIAGLMVAGNAFAADSTRADGFRIESEAQFVRDYGDEVDHLGPGVYQVVKGKLAGKTVAIGEAGLAYDLRTQRAMQAEAAKQGRNNTEQSAYIRYLEAEQARYATDRAQRAGNISPSVSANGSLFCIYYPYNRSSPIYYYGGASVSAATELYLDNGGGGLNFYYARASATAGASVNRPYNVPYSPAYYLHAYAINRQTNESVTRSGYGADYGSASTGYVYSGPAFGHNLYAAASVSGVGNCSGYVSISDSMGGS